MKKRMEIREQLEWIETLLIVIAVLLIAIFVALCLGCSGEVKREKGNVKSQIEKIKTAAAADNSEWPDNPWDRRWTEIILSAEPNDIPGICEYINELFKQMRMEEYRQNSTPHGRRWMGYLQECADLSGKPYIQIGPYKIEADLLGGQPDGTYQIMERFCLLSRNWMER